VSPDYDPGIEKVLEPFFDDFYTIQFRNYPVDVSYVAHSTIVPTAAQAGG